MRNDWLNRLTKEFIQNTSPMDMLQRFGFPFNGKAGSNSGWIYDPDLSSVSGFPPKYWVITGDVVSLMSPAQRAAIDAAELQAGRDALVAELQNLESRDRALALALLDVVNFLSAKTTAILDAIDAGSSLAQVKANIAAITDAPQRTTQDLLTLLRSKLGS